jgi:hypothetical protein
MRRVMFATTAIMAVAAAGLFAQKTTEVHPGKGGSPHVRTEYKIDGAAISIEYGRPSLKGRPEETMMPPRQPWRTGADEATLLVTDKPLKFGKFSLPAGTHTINTQPDVIWELIFGKLDKPGQWGIPYNASLEIGRTPMTVTKLSKPVEQLTISLEDTPKGGALRIEWGTTSVRSEFIVG